MSSQIDLRTMSYAEFLDMADGSMLEWVDGKVVPVAPAATSHQRLAVLLTSVLSIFVEQRGLGEVFAPPYQMKLAHSGREPDLLFVAHAHADRILKTYLDGPADLVLEIVSPESKRRDRVEKRAEYEAAGIPEYCLVDPEQDRLTWYRLDEKGRYRALLPDAHGRIHSQVLPGFWLDPLWLWRQPLPPALTLLSELGVLD
jgi:Uma2 family endonuclease